MAVDMAISATEKPLGKVFTSDYQLTIPSFQRAYTWQAENIEQLVNDLQDACADPDTPYFLGSLILGAWGCGAFGNDGHLVAQLFHRALETDFKGAFKEVTFAIVDTSPEKKFIGPFAKRFQ